MKIILLVIPACLLVFAEARKVQLRQRVQEPQIYYEEEEEAQPAEADDYVAQVAYQPRTRALPSARSKETLQGSKPPPVQTIRNYNKVNDDGSFTFGYEAADGSFKEETRGTDCVVRGKYGYIDPDGNKREFTYVSGNPCDPNAPKEEDEEDLAKKQEPDDVSGPANYPAVRPVPLRASSQRPNYPSTTAKAPTTIFQTEYQLDDDASQELEEESKPQQLRPAAFRRPQYVQVVAEPSSPLYQPAATPTTSPTLYRLASTASAPRYNSPTSPAPPRQSSYYQPIESSTARAAPVTRARPQSVAITPRPHVAQVAAQYVSPSSTERPGVVFAPRTITPVHSTTTATPPSQHLDFAAELERYVNSVGSPTPRPQVVQAPQGKYARPQAQQPGQRPEPIYQSELVFDPSTGQYNTQLYQTLPQTLGDFSLSHKLQPFVATQQQPLVGLSQNPIYRSAASQPQPAQQPAPQQQRQPPQPQEAVFRKQQSQLLQQSQQLYAQQQRRQQVQAQQAKPSGPGQRIQLLQEVPRDAQNFYYIAAAAPSSHRDAGPISIGQIDQFLRGNAANF